MHTVYSDDVSPSPSTFPTGSKLERRKQIPTFRTSGAISPKRCEQLNYLDCVRVFLLPLELTSIRSSLSCYDLMMHDRLASSTDHLPTPHTCWDDIFCGRILWFLRYL